MGLRSPPLVATSIYAHFYEIIMSSKSFDTLLSIASKYVGLKYDLHTAGLENVPDGPAILFGNHLKIDDSFILWSTIANELGRPLVFGTIADVFRWPLRPFLEDMGHIPVNQRNRPDAVRSLLGGIARVMDEGGLAYVFPEGTTPHDGLVHKFFTTAAQAALNSGVPLIPDGKRYEEHELFAPTTAYVEFGTPIKPEEYAGMNRRALSNIMQERVASLAHRATSDVYSKDQAFKFLGERDY